MKNLLFYLKYDGTNYHGWQVQKNATTIQGTFQECLSSVLSQKFDIKGCSRTDAGVHANMYCCNCKVETKIPNKGIVSAVNNILPKDIVVYDCVEVDDEFHSRYNCKSKEYIYKIYNDEIRNPFYDKYALHHKYYIDEKMLNEQAQYFLGTKDFVGFSSTGSSVLDTVRTIKSISVTRENSLVELKIEGDGFLYNMVRIITGTLLDVSDGKIKKDELPNIISSKNRKLAGRTAPAHGLYLNKINY